MESFFLKPDLMLVKKPAFSKAPAVSTKYTRYMLVGVLVEVVGALAHAELLGRKGSKPAIYWWLPAIPQLFRVQWGFP